MAIKLEGGGEGLNGLAIGGGTFFCGFPNLLHQGDGFTKQRNKKTRLSSKIFLFLW